MTLNYFNYFTEIEEHFVRKRAQNLLISPLDWCLIELWKENGIPLHVVLRGIDRSFGTAQRKRNTPRTLFYCHPAVLEAFEEYQEAVLGESPTEGQTELEGGEPELSREVVCNFIDELRDQLEERDGEAFDRARERISALSSELSVRTDLNLREIDASLVEIASMLTGALRARLDDRTWKSIQAESRNDLKIYRKHLAPATFERLRQKQIERSLREYFDLPEFSLLHCE